MASKTGNNAQLPRLLPRPHGSIAYHVTGDGPCVVLIPSLGRGAEDFDRLAADLVQKGYLVLRPEPRGIAGSTPLLDSDTLHDMAADIAAILDETGLGPAIVMGHAAGNWVARVLAHDRPDLIRAVALLAAIVSDPPPDDIRASITASFDMSLSEETRLGHLERVYFAKGSDARLWLEGWFPDVAKAQRRAAAMTSDTSWKQIFADQAALYLGALDDVISPPPDPDDLKKRIGPQAELRVIANAGHALLPEQPQAVARALDDWMSTLPPA